MSTKNTTVETAATRQMRVDSCVAVTLRYEDLRERVLNSSETLLSLCGVVSLYGLAFLSPDAALYPCSHIYFI